MNELNSGDSASGQTSRPASRRLWVLACGGLLVILICLLLPKRDTSPDVEAVLGGAAKPMATEDSGVTATRAWPRSRRPRIAAGPAASPEEIVAAKVSQFARSRREILHAMAERFKIPVPAEYDQFFDLAEAGKWDELKTAFDALWTKRRIGEQPENLPKLWGAIHETFGVAAEAQKWPAQKLLDYGNAILDSLRPGMVYVGGTDPGRFIPTLLNETSDDERHVVLTQNALADGTYLDYIRFLYEDRLAPLTEDDSQRCFQDYIADAQKRALHDQQSPDEPKQLRPNEDVRVQDGRTQVSGDVAVMLINENLLQTLMKKNPDASFALEESFPLKSTYADATLLGPVMELRAPDGQNSLTSELAAQSTSYWRDITQQFVADPGTAEDSWVRKTYSKMAAAQANLLADHDYSAEAEQDYRLASQIAPSLPEAVTGLSELLARTGRASEARQLLDDFARSHPDQRATVESVVGRFAHP